MLKRSYYFLSLYKGGELEQTMLLTIPQLPQYISFSFLSTTFSFPVSFLYFSLPATSCLLGCLHLVRGVGRGGRQKQTNPTTLLTQINILFIKSDLLLSDLKN